MEDAPIAVFRSESHSGRSRKVRKIREEDRHYHLIGSDCSDFAAAILAAIFWLKKENTQKKFDTHIEKGQKYLEEMDYEKAADNYLAAIDIDPKAEDPYMKLADLYLEIDQPENAAIVLKRV